MIMNILKTMGQGFIFLFCLLGVILGFLGLFWTYQENDANFIRFLGNVVCIIVNINSTYMCFKMFRWNKVNPVLFCRRIYPNPKFWGEK